MNWKEIKEKYPKAFDLFFEWFKGDSKVHMTKKEFLDVNDIVVMGGDLRELYDFFDEQGIYISMDIWHDYDTGNMNIDLEIVHKKITEVGLFNSRPKAEQQAFLKAFEILEGKLT